jgi:hypothetical protein
MLDETQLKFKTAGNYLPSLWEIVQFALILLSMVLVFYVNRVMAFKYLAIIMLAILAFISNKKLIWIAILWVIIDSVGGLFSDRATGEVAIGIPVINISSGISIGIKDLLLMAMIFSITPINRFSRITYDHLLFFGVILSAVFIGSTFFDVNFKILISVVVRGYFIFLLYYTVKAEFSLQKLFHLFHLISLLLPIILLDQIFQIIFGTRIITQFAGVQIKTLINTFSGETRAFSFGTITLFFTFIYGLLLLTIKRTKEMRLASFFYGTMLVLMSLTSIMLSATRGVIGVFGIILLFVSPYLVLKFRNIAIVLGVIFFLLNILGGVGLDVDYFYRNTVVRVMATVVPALTGSGLSEMDTSGRTDELPALLEGIKGSPIVGYGISNNLFDYYNSNFGGMNTIIQFGFAGAILILIVILSWMFHLNKVTKHLPKNSIYQSTGRVVYASLIGMMVGYLTTYNYFTSFFPFDVLRLIFIMYMSYLVFSYGREISWLQLLEAKADIRKA